MRHAEKNEINLKIKKSANMVTLDRSTVTKCSSWGRLAIQIARDPFACRDCEEPNQRDTHLKNKRNRERKNHRV
jgi:hypothetical protein